MPRGGNDRRHRPVSRRSGFNRASTPSRCRSLASPPSSGRTSSSRSAASRTSTSRSGVAGQAETVNVVGRVADHQHRAVRLLDEHQSDHDRQPADQYPPLVDVRADDARRGARRELRPGQLPRHLGTAQQQHRRRRRQHAGVFRRGTRPDPARLLAELGCRSRIPGDDVELFGRIRARGRRRCQRGHEERHQQLARIRLLLSARQQVGRNQSVPDPDGDPERREHPGSAQAEGPPPAVRRDHRRTDRTGPGLLLLQLRSAGAKLPRRRRAEQSGVVLRAVQRRRTGDVRLARHQPAPPRQMASPSSRV